MPLKEAQGLKVTIQSMMVYFIRYILYFIRQAYEKRVLMSVIIGLKKTLLKSLKLSKVHLKVIH